MKYNSTVPAALLFVLLFLISCTKTESDFSEPETISLTSSSTSVAVGSVVNFSAFNSSGANITANTVIYINGTAITGNSYTFTQPGSYVVYAKKGGLATPNITITVINSLAGYIHNVLVEEYSGTWCGNCPRLLYGVDLLKQQTEKAFVVSIHLFGGDPFITTDGNSLAAYRGVGSVPTGHINRNVNWTGPQYEHVNQVINEIKAGSAVGLAINSTITGSAISVQVKYAFKEPPASATKLTVYLVEDGLKYTQRNYSANLYGGQSSIPNFNYDGVLRKVISSVQGDNAVNAAAVNEMNYSFTLPSNVSVTANAKIVAFISDAGGNVLNTQKATLGTEKDFERL
jgi:hypothetical protein